MNDQPCFRLTITLQKYCSLQLSAMLWGKEDIIKDMENIFESISNLSVNELYKLKSKSPFENKKWCNVTDKVIYQSELLHAHVAAQLSEFIIFMGKKIYRMFFVMINDGFQFKSKYIQKPFFTNQGLIDKYKMYQEWKKDPCYPDFNDNANKNIIIASYLACIHGDFDFLCQGSLEKLVIAIKVILRYSLKINNWNRAIAVLLHWKMSGGLSPPQDGMFNRSYLDLLQNPNNEDKDSQLFTYCISAGCEKTAEYFYLKLDEIEKENIIMPAAEDVGNFRNVEPTEEIYEEMVGTILYLFKKMSNEQKKFFLSRDATINNLFLMFIKTWPYQYFCIELLENGWGCMTDMMKSNILHICFEQLCSFSYNHNAIHREILEWLMPKIPGNLKLDVFKSNYHKRFHEKLLRGLFELFKKSDFSTLKIIINDPDLSGNRSELIDIKEHLPDYIKEENDFESVRIKIETYMTELDFSNSEKDNFFQYLNKPEILELMIRHNRFQAVDQFIKWNYESDKDTMDLKLNEIRASLNPETVYSNIIENGDYSSCLNFLQWYYVDRDEELENFKKIINSPEFICEKFWFTWIKTYFDNDFHTLNCKFECLKLLKHFFKTQEEIDAFKKEIVENENCIKMFCGCLLKLQINIESENLHPGVRLPDVRAGIPDVIERTPDVRCVAVRDIDDEMTASSSNSVKKWMKMIDWKKFKAALDDALTFCSAESDKISEMKENVKGNIDWWIDFYGNSRYELLVLNGLIKWLRFEAKEEKFIVKRFLESGKGAALCVEMFRFGDIRDDAKGVLESWIRRCGDVDKIKEEIGLLNDVDERSIVMAKNFLDQVNFF